MANDCLSKARIITVEPIIFIYNFATILADPAQKVLVYNKVCLHFLNDTTVCNDLKNESNHDAETTVQSHASYWFLYIDLCFEIPSILVTFMYGNLSDHFNRKVALVAPIIGQMISVACWITVSLFPQSAMIYLLIGPLVNGIFGGWVTSYVGCMSYLSDVSKDESRTTRIAVAEWAESLASAMGLFASGVYLDATSFRTVMYTTMAFHVLTVLYIAIWIKEPETRTKKTSSCGAICSDVIGPKAAWSTFTTVFRKRELNRRMQISVLYLALFLGIVATQPMWSLTYLFTKKQPLSWPTSVFGYFNGYTLLLEGSVVLLVGPIMKKRMGMRDTSIMILSMTMTMMAVLLFGFCTKTWMVFLVPVIDILGYARVTCQRALMSTMVDKNELGQMFAIFGSLQSGSNLVASNIYNNLYPITLHFWAGICFTLAAVLCIFPLGLYIWVHVNIKKMEHIAKTEFSMKVVGVENGMEERKALIENMESESDTLSSSSQEDEFI